MHVLHRPNLPRLMSVSIAAAILAIVISLALASSLSNISRPANGMSVSAHRTAPGAMGALHPTAPGSASDPLTSLLGPPIGRPWPTAHR